MADRLKITLVACSFHINFNLVKVRVNKISNIIDRRDRKKINNISIIPIVYKALTFRREIAVVIIKNYNLLFRNYL